MTARAKAGTIRISPVVRNGQTYERFILDLGMVDGNRIRRSFSTYEEAAAVQKQQSGIQKKIGSAAKRLTDVQLADAAQALTLLAGEGSLTEAAEAYRMLTGEQRADAVAALAELTGQGSLAEAAAFWMRHNKPEGGNPATCSQMLDQYIARAERAGRRPATLTELRAVTRSFIGTFGSEPVAHVTASDLDRWHEKQNGGPVTLNKHRRILIALFNLALQKQWIETNPASRLTVATEPKRLPYVMPVADVDKMLLWAAGNTPDMVPYYALALFAGIRPTGELQRLDWKNIDFTRKEIYIAPEVSKTHDERFVPMSDNLVAWLEPHRQKSGPVFYSRRKFRQMQTKAEIRYEADCFRHSFGSYHLVQHENRHATADAMGHRSLGMIFKHYRRAVRKEDAAAFWQIMPAAADNVILLKAG